MKTKNFLPVFHKVKLDDFNYSFLRLSCKAPYTRIIFTMNPDESLINYLKEKMDLNYSDKEISDIISSFEHSYDVEDILTTIYERANQKSQMEVLYIGQSQGREKKRGALERLKSHETLQKVLIDCHTQYPNKRIFIMLFKFAEQQIMFFNGVHKNFQADSKDDERHHSELVEEAIDIVLNSDRDKMRQVINITEAAMINYFKPPYNSKFVDNFPSNMHQSYKHYYNLEYNEISVELALGQICLYTKESKIESVWDFIEYELFPDDRASIYDILKNISRG